LVALWEILVLLGGFERRKNYGRVFPHWTDHGIVGPNDLLATIAAVWSDFKSLENVAAILFGWILRFSRAGNGGESFTGAAEI
jgi:hypothetical protein